MEGTYQLVDRSDLWSGRGEGDEGHDGGEEGDGGLHGRLFELVVGFFVCVVVLGYGCGWCCWFLDESL